jgi:hypothetical protein
MHYCWSKEWIQPHESSWSIIEKFKIANQITYQEFKDIFRLENYKEPKKSSDLDYTNLYTLSGFDDQKIIDIFGISIKEHEKDNIRLITTKLPIDNNYFRKNLAYCPVCINVSFHSIFHQFSFIQYCPYHLIPLLKNCVNCTKIIPYSFKSKKSNGNYDKCECQLNYPNNIINHGI